MMTKTQTTKTHYYLRTLIALVLTGLMLAAMLPAAAPVHASTTFVVNSAADLADVNVGDGVCDADFATGNLCTLRAAISESNTIAGEDVINFNIPGTGVKTISPQTNLPNIIDTVTIDGFTQTGAYINTLAKGTNAKLMIELNGSGVTGTFESTGLRLSAPNSTVQGLVINRFTSGVAIFAQGASLQQNFIGTDPSGTLNRGNSLGVFNQGSQSQIGGNFPEEANLISGNDGAGISIRSLASSTGVINNLVGTDRSGTKRLGNSDAGVEITGSSNNFVEDNTIAFNGEDGVEISNDNGDRFGNTSGNTVASNSIFSNGGLGINLVDPSALVPVGSSEGPTANDTGDTDVGPNGLQNFPVVTSAETLSSKTIIKARLNSAPNEPYDIQFFSNPSGTREGKTFIGAKTGVSTNGSGNVSFTFQTTNKIAPGQNITATATRGFTLDTSEFSAPRTVKDAAAPTVKRVAPAENATGVSPSANPTAFFSEAMNPSTINRTTVTLKKAGTTKNLVAGVTYDAAAKKAVLDPKPSLTKGATYVATVGAGAKDTAGNALDQNPNVTGNQVKIWKFQVKN